MAEIKAGTTLTCFGGNERYMQYQTRFLKMYADENDELKKQNW